MKRFARSFLLLLAASAPTSPALADFDIVLRDGGKMIADSYQVDGEKLIVYSSNGMLEIERGRIQSVRERASGDRSAAARSDEASGDGAAPRSPIAADTRTAPEPISAAAPVSLADTSARERELSRQIIIANRDLLFAHNRGDDAESIQKRKREIARLENERKELGKKSANR
ncbi:MAG: hypothetical protein ACREQQ_16710 [Candidatus Binatia bacterium]